MTNLAKIGLIGQSHLVSLLDAIGPWRDQIASRNENLPNDYPPLFAGFIDKTFNEIVRLKNDTADGYSFDITAAVLGGAGRQHMLATWQPDNKIGLVGDLLVKMCAPLADCPIIISVLQGTEFNPLKYVKDAVEYRVAGYGGLGKHAVPIDQGYIAAHADRLVRDAIPSIFVVKILCPSARLIHVPPPPPVRDPAKIDYREGLRDQLEKQGFAEPGTRLMWYRMQVAGLVRQLKSICEVVDSAPPGTTDDDGFIKPEFAHGLTHANADYGELLWPHILKAAGV